MAPDTAYLPSALTATAVTWDAWPFNSLREAPSGRPRRRKEPSRQAHNA